MAVLFIKFEKLMLIKVDNCVKRLNRMRNVNSVNLCIFTIKHISYTVQNMMQGICEEFN